jgi:hypothetical protein
MTALALTILAKRHPLLEFGSGDFSPERGVICHCEGNFCAEGTGISTSWTEQFMGAETAYNIANAEQSEWVYHNGVDCTLADQTRCSEWVRLSLTLATRRKILS